LRRAPGGALLPRPCHGLTDRLPRCQSPADPRLVYGCVAAAGLLAVAMSSAAAVVSSRYRRPSDARRGMATRAEGGGCWAAAGCERQG